MRGPGPRDVRTGRTFSEGRSLRVVDIERVGVLCERGRADEFFESFLRLRRQEPAQQVAHQRPSRSRSPSRDRRGGGSSPGAGACRKFSPKIVAENRQEGGANDPGSAKQEKRRSASMERKSAEVAASSSMDAENRQEVDDGGAR